jgi:lipoprotein-anchoring transpeptidase ErfK/SrfK
MRNRTFIFVAGFLVVLLVGAGAVYLYDASQSDDIADGVKVGGIPVGGLTRTQAKEKLQRELGGTLTQPVVVTAAGGNKFTLTAKRAKVTMDIDGMVDEAVDKSREGSVVTRAFRSVTGGTVNADLPPKVDYSATAVNRLVRRVKRKVNHEPVNASIQPTADGLKEVAAHNGIRLKTTALRSEVEKMLTAPSADRTIKADITKVAPKVTVHDLTKKYPNYIIVNRGGFQLTYYHNLKLTRTYPIAVGQQGLETPAGLYDVQDKQVNPSWHVPNSDWAGSLAGQVIPPGPTNPLKARWMGIDGGAGIHGTADTGSLGSAASHGCIRMAVPDVEDLYDRVEVGTPVYII